MARPHAGPVLDGDIEHALPRWIPPARTAAASGRPVKERAPAHGFSIVIIIAQCPLGGIAVHIEKPPGVGPKRSYVGSHALAVIEAYVRQLGPLQNQMRHTASGLGDATCGHHTALVPAQSGAEAEIRQIGPGGKIVINVSVVQRRMTSSPAGVFPLLLSRECYCQRTTLREPVTEAHGRLPRDPHHGLLITVEW